MNYWHQDHLGSSAVITDGAGNKVETITYYPYGGTRTNVPGTPVNVPYKYTGQELDSSTGLYDYGARQYEPALGRFTSADTIVPNARDPQSLNRYAYVRNNPLRYIDPSGHKEGEWGNGFFDDIECWFGGCDDDLEPPPPPPPAPAPQSTYGSYTPVQVTMFQVEPNSSGSSYNGGGAGLQGVEGASGTAGPAGIYLAANDSGPQLITNFISLTGDLLGKVWNAPNTALGLSLGVLGEVIGLPLAIFTGDIPYPTIGNNAIQFINNPLIVDGYALTLGNAISYAPGFSPQDVVSAYGESNIPLGLHEQAHTYQSQYAGVFFLPSYFVQGGISSQNVYERQANKFARGLGGPLP